MKPNMTTEGPGLSPERLDELEAMRPWLLRQVTPGVYTYAEEPAPNREAAAEEERAARWDAIAEKAARDKDEQTATVARAQAALARGRAAAMRGRR